MVSSSMTICGGKEERFRAGRTRSHPSECRAGLRLLSSTDAAEFCLPGDEEWSQDGKPVLLGPGQSGMQSSPRCLVPNGS